MPLPAAVVYEHARALGFTQAGIIPAAPSPRLDAYQRWIAAGMQGEMAYLARPDRQQRRQDLTAILPGARSLIVVALDYATLAVPESVLSDPRRGRISAYAWGADYHAVMTPRLEQMAARLIADSGGEAACRVYVDTGALLERSHAQQAGLGFTGKNTMLIHPRRGSLAFLGEIITTADFDTTNHPHRETMCGTCTRCLTACPTGAFPEPYVLDARRCISYLTIELKRSIPVALRPLMGNWVYGCDICQEVCPFTRRFAAPCAEAAFFPSSVDRAAPLLADVLALDEEGFRERFAGSALVRIGRERLVRNACVAAGNGPADSLGNDIVSQLERLAADESALVREHAIWALARQGK